MSEGNEGSRRALLTGGAVLLGGVVLAQEGTAEAADGKALLIGRSNKASHGTALTSSGTAATLSVSSTKSAAIKATSSVRKQPAISATNPGDKYGHDGTAVLGRVGPNTSAALNAAVRTAAGTFAGPVGVLGASTTGTVGANHQGIGVAAVSAHPGGYALVAGTSNGATAFFANGDSTLGGNVSVSGTLSKSGGSFKIDHPQDPANKYLYHSFVESPDMKNVYDGVVETNSAGSATVTMPAWFDSLNRDFRYQLTALGAAAPNLHVSSEIANNAFGVAGAQPNQRVCWLVTGIRKDTWANDHRIPVEETKPRSERGTYLYPEGVGKPQTAGLTANTMPRLV